jgi:hypothetical protein
MAFACSKQVGIMRELADFVNGKMTSEGNLGGPVICWVILLALHLQRLQRLQYLAFFPDQPFVWLFYARFCGF